MKRTNIAQDSNPTKKLKLDSPPTDDTPQEGLDSLFQPTLRRKATDIHNLGLDGTGYIEGFIRMKWPLKDGKQRVRLALSENAQTVGLEITFSDRCAVTLASSGVRLEVYDDIQLSLRGAECRTLKYASSNSLPLELEYRDKIALRFLTRAKPSEPLLSINTITGTSSVIIFNLTLHGAL